MFDITDDQLCDLRDDASEATDADLYNLCNAALGVELDAESGTWVDGEPDLDARRKCAAIIGRARGRRPYVRHPGDKAPDYSNRRSDRYWPPGRG